MALHVVTGPANAGKTGHLHDRVRDAVRDGDRALLLLPNERDVVRAMEEMGRSCPIGLEVMQFDAYLDQLWVRWGDGRRVVRGIQRQSLIERAVSEVSLRHLTTSSSRPGFVRLLATLVDRACEGGAGDGAYATGPAGELLEILSRYRKLLAANGLVERSEAHRLVTEGGESGSLPAAIAVNRFTGLTTPQERFVVAAARHADVWVSLVYDESVGATAAAEQLVGRLVAQNGERVTLGARYSADVELARVERCLASRQPVEDRRVVPRGSVVFSEAWGDLGEAARIVREIQDALETGANPEDVAVVFRDPARHMGVMQHALAEAGIVADWDVMVPVRRSGLGRALGLLTASLASGARTEFVGFLRSGYAGVDVDEVDRLDRRLRKSRVRGIAELLNEARALGPAMSSLVETAGRLARPGTARRGDWYDLVGAMMRAAYSPGVLLDAGGLLDAATRRTVLAAVDEWCELDGGAPGPSDIATFVADASVALTPMERGGRVQITGADRIRGRRFEHVILGGLTASEFPRLPEDDALTAPGLLAELERAGIDMAPRVDLAAERLLFYMVVTRARSRLVMSRRSADDDGEAVRPSVFWDEVLDLYRDPGTDEWYAGEPAWRELTLDDMAEAEAAPHTERRRLRTLAEVGTAATGHASDDARLAHARYRNRPHQPFLSGDVRAWLASREVFSASEIESYLQCPFSWYFSSVLRPESLDEEVGAAAGGQVAHAVMRRFYELFGEEVGESRVTPETLETALDVHRRSAEEVVSGVTTIGFLEDAEIRTAVRGTRGLVEEDATFLPACHPVAHELAFGLPQDEAIDEPHDMGEFKLKGRIDRVDVGPHGVVVIDYKRRSVGSESSAPNFERSGLVQLPLYAKVASDRLGEPIAGGLYRSVLRRVPPRGFLDSRLDDGGDLKKYDRADAETIAAIVANAVERAHAAVEGIRSAAIPVGQAASERCLSYCLARHACPKNGGRGA